MQTVDKIFITALLFILWLSLIVQVLIVGYGLETKLDIITNMVGKYENYEKYEEPVPVIQLTSPYYKTLSDLEEIDNVTEQNTRTIIEELENE
jgi:hypothetical protein